MSQRFIAKKCSIFKKITDQMLLDTNAILSLPNENKEKAANYKAFTWV